MTTKDCLRIVRECRWVQRMRQQKGERLVLAAMLFVGCIGAGECFSAEAANVGLKLGAGGFNYRESGEQGNGNVFLPMLSGRIDSEKCFKDGRPESIAGSNAPSVSLPPQREPVSREGDKDSSGESYQCDGYCGLYFSLPLWIVALWAGVAPTMKHNVM
ncbi:hypothetical protein [Rhodoferax sp.]|uniref:hypothetical protein n=1 Tax=Rhodoferax sp. TaxID=50421 RepID=UPI0026294B64|nr:hypothetical protein [Rhodoferax sp.]MDD2920113.1 hypothetical protein [Rhodoferax sp.]